MSGCERQKSFQYRGHRTDTRFTPGHVVPSEESGAQGEGPPGRVSGTEVRSDWDGGKEVPSSRVRGPSPLGRPTRHTHVVERRRHLYPRRSTTLRDTHDSGFERDPGLGRPPISVGKSDLWWNTRSFGASILRDGLSFRIGLSPRTPISLGGSPGVGRGSSRVPNCRVSNCRWTPVHLDLSDPGRTSWDDSLSPPSSTGLGVPYFVNCFHVPLCKSLSNLCPLLAQH